MPLFAGFSSVLFDKAARKALIRSAPFTGGFFAMCMLLIALGALVWNRCTKSQRSRQFAGRPDVSVELTAAEASALASHLHLQ